MSLAAGLQARWSGLSAREQSLLRASGWLCLAALVWWLGLAPAFSALRQAERQRPLLDAQWQQMQHLQAQARAIQAQPALAAQQTRQALEASVKSLGPAAQLTAQGDRLTVTFRAVSAEAWAQWLAQVRLNARALPAETRLLRGASGAWDGTVVFNLAGS
jgi:general secretion pathway protein M